MKVLCKSCGRKGEAEQKLKGSVFITLILLCFYIVPGIIYMIWRRTSLPNTCSVCGSSAVIPVNSPEADRIEQERESQERVKCPECSELVLHDAKKCKHCGCALVSQ